MFKAIVSAALAIGLVFTNVAKAQTAGPGDPRSNADVLDLCFQGISKSVSCFGPFFASRVLPMAPCA